MTSETPTGEDDWGESTISVDEVAAPSSGDERYYLLVFERDSSLMYNLPATGDVFIGRADAVNLRLTDTSVSRKHAKITLVAGEARISDLESQNGTKVNGERVTGARPLLSGDTISICGVTLVFHSNRRAQGVRSVVDFGRFRVRAEEELERSLRYRRPATIISCVLGTGGADWPRAARAILAAVRRIDTVGWGGADQLLCLIPETSVDEAPESAARILASLARMSPDAKVGYASCPSDGCDVDTLIASARAAAVETKTGEVGAAAKTYGTLTIADRKIVVADPAMTRLYALLERLAAVDLPVLIGGETGSGKELAASALHSWSARVHKPLVALNCAAIQESLVESELFGHEKGAFSGAVAAKAGLLEMASGGTVFLDEIGELSAGVQAKLLRVLETKRLIRVGEVKERAIDIRVVAATNRNLEDEVKAGRFRQDLFFRLSGAMLWIPPLRDRKRELPILAQTFLEEACKKAGRHDMVISDAAMQSMLTYGWPGNVRQLKNVMEYVAAAYTDAVLEPWHLTDRLNKVPTREELAGESTPPPPAPAGAPPRFRALEEEIRELEKSRIVAALAASGGNQTRAAELIGVPLRTFFAKVKHYGLRPNTKDRT